MRKNGWKDEELAEDFCFVCKDGGYLRVCDFRKCLKSYHYRCVDKDESFLESNDTWICGLHSCMCGKSSSYQCFCCPTSFCEACVTSGDFVQWKKEMGFCANCLRLAKLIEEGKNVDSDGEEVDFDNTETYEFLFKDYWETIKGREGLTIKDIQTIDALLKRGEIPRRITNIDKDNEDDEWKTENEEDGDFDDNHKLKIRRGKHCAKSPNNKSKKRKIFNGWASEELRIFLSSVGKYSNEPLCQLDVTLIVKDYIESNNLFQGNKKKKNHVIPDDKLYPLFRKKKIKYHKIFESLKCHLAQFDDKDDFSLSSEEVAGSLISKKLKLTSLDSKSSNPGPMRTPKLPEQPKSLYAAIEKDNIKLVYLRKSLILELLENFEEKFETFEDKVVGCFVKIKNDPRDYYYPVQKPNQIGQVTGIKKTKQVYKVGERNIDIVLHVSNFSKDVKLSTLADDDVEEEDCKDLRDLVKKGLFKQPLTEDLERKIKRVHEDIENHSINKELLRLEKQIERANEKGWRRELNEYIDRRELLKTPEEKMRRLNTIPFIIPYKEDTEGSMVESSNLLVADKGAVTATPGKPSEEKSRDLHNNGEEVQVQELDEIEPKCTSNEEKLPVNSYEVVSMNNREEEIPMKNHEVVPRNNHKELATNNHEEEAAAKNNDEIIDIDDEDENEDDDLTIIDESEGNKAAAVDVERYNQVIWRYRDPSGTMQGPFALHLFRHWQLFGYFDEDFKIWKDGQSEEEAILLNDALRALIS